MATAALPASPFSSLLARYMQGEITDTLWARMMRLFDADGVSTSERLAFARFINDVVSEGGAAALFIPKVKEVQDLLSATRH